jgi:putative transcriptional regulator
MNKVTENRSLFERLRDGLNEGIQFAQGELELRTTEIPRRPRTMGGREVESLRRHLKMSQRLFARMLNVSPRTVQSWERGARQPAKAALRLLQILEARPGVVCEVVGLRRGQSQRQRARANRRS